ncbi:unnamed protein product, partial [Mesorhabditis belari]|uniref:Uncharacterized protein n=1 Tax=Mesorhabditis belari TaxID=2138241 RepID=A0AAF3J3Q4_9BILA
MNPYNYHYYRHIRCHRRMGLFSHLIALAVGVYGGAYAVQNYQVPKLPSGSELTQRLEDYLKQYKKKSDEK